MQDKKIIVTGATGLVGKALCEALSSRGYSVVVFSRNSQMARKKVPGASEYYDWTPGVSGPWENALDGASAVITLHGEPLFNGRLSQARYERAMQTRIVGVRELVSAMLKAKTPPKSFLVGSSVGIYGFEGPDDEIVSERTPDGSDYHATSNAVWEHAAHRAAWTGIRTVYLRTGIVWGKDGGMAANQFIQFKRGWGNVIGGGLNWLPWIHSDDEVGAILYLLENEHLTGAFNLSAPNPVRYRDYADILGEIVGKPVKAKMAEWLVRLRMGRAADMILRNRRMVPTRLIEAGYEFKHPDARPALRDLFPTK